LNLGFHAYFKVKMAATLHILHQSPSSFNSAILSLLLGIGESLARSAAPSYTGLKEGVKIIWALGKRAQQFDWS